MQTPLSSVFLEGLVELASMAWHRLDPHAFKGTDTHFFLDLLQSLQANFF